MPIIKIYEHGSLIILSSSQVQRSPDVMASIWYKNVHKWLQPAVKAFRKAIDQPSLRLLSPGKNLTSKCLVYLVKMKNNIIWLQKSKGLTSQHMIISLSRNWSHNKPMTFFFFNCIRSNPCNTEAFMGCKKLYHQRMFKPKIYSFQPAIDPYLYSQYRFLWWGIICHPLCLWSWFGHLQNSPRVSQLFFCWFGGG